MDESDALEQLRVLCAITEHPTLDDVELLQCLRGARRPDAAGNPPSNVDTAASWTPTTEFTAGSVIKVGARWWKASVTATTGSTSPDWPDLDGDTRSGMVVVDGDQSWVDNGARWAGRWDIDAAASAAWRIKAAKASSGFDFSTDGQSFSRSQVVDACLRMARTFRSSHTVRVGC